MILEKSPKARLLFPLMSLVLGAAALGALTPILGPESAGLLYEIANAYTNGGVGYGAAQALFACVSGGGALSIVSCFIGLLHSHCAKTTAATHVLFLLLSVIGALVCIAGGAYYSTVFDMFGQRIYIEYEHHHPKLAGAQLGMLDFALGMFNPNAA